MSKSFESSLNELEKIVSKLETNEIDLQDAVDSFSKGIKLVEKCQKDLQNAEQKVQVLIDGNLQDYKANAN